MEFDRSALQFYLDHEEQTREARESFLNGGPVDLSVVPVHIYNSWVRSSAYGVNPYTAYLSTHSTMTVARNTDQFKALAQYKNESIVFSIGPFKYEILLFDRDGQALIGRRYEHVPALEQNIGTTSVTLAFASGRPTTCFGYQNYLAPCCHQFCMSAPILFQNELVAAVVVMLSPEQLRLEHYYEQAIDLIIFLEHLYRTFYGTYASITQAEQICRQILPLLNDGVVVMDKQATDVYCNDAAKSLLNLPGQPECSSVRKKITQIAKSDGIASETLSVKKADIVHQENLYYDAYVIKRENRQRKKPDAPVHGRQVAKYTFQSMIGSSQAFLRAKNDALIVAPTQATVLLQGLSGVGKEVFAQSIHNASTRKNAPFVALNCGTIPPELLASELFGYEAGAFTGASSSGKIGVIEAASGGTLFLDEVESMPTYHQAALLRCLSSGFIRRVGGVVDIPINIRLISAAKLDLSDAEQQKNWNISFRSDLYYRISACQIYIPALKEHPEDIAELCQSIIERKKQELNFPHITATDEFIDTLFYYDWPGNIRELENVVERAIIFMDPEEQLLTPALLYPSILKNAEQNRQLSGKGFLPNPHSDKTALHTAEDMVIRRYLLQTGLDVKATAQCLGISTPTLYRKIRASAELSSLLKGKKRNTTKGPST